MGSLSNGIEASRRQRKTAAAFALLLIASLAAAPSAEAQGPPYSFTKVQYPDSIYTDVTGINNDGHAVGTYRDANGNWHGYLFDGTNYTTVDFPGAAFNFVFGISNTGVILGSYADAYLGPYHGFTYDGGVFTSFDYPGEADWGTDARAMNASGHIVGGYDTGAGMPPHGYVKDSSGHTSIDYPGSLGGVANGINDDGTIVGTHQDNSGALHGYIRWNGQFSALNFPLATNTYLGGINNASEMVGWTRQGGATRGFVYTTNRFRAFHAAFPGVATTLARAINDSGQVGGTYSGADCPSGCGFIATPQAGVPRCDQTFTLGYADGTLTMDFTLTMAEPTTWSVWLVVTGTATQLWSLAAPALPTSTPLSVPIPGFGARGMVAGVSLLSNAAGQVLCADIATADTGF